MTIIWFVIITIISTAVGAFVEYLLIMRNMVGALRIDRSDPEDQPYIFLELNQDVEKTSSKKIIVLRVKNENFISQK